jgi:NADPH:quinone reductase-like Zn-dependent oxidoreductase
MSHTVLRLPSPGSGLQSLQSFTEPIPSILPNQILVRVRAASLNYRDIAICNGTYPLKTADNIVLGSDLAGEVVRVGDQVPPSQATVGDRVISPVSPDFLYGIITPETHLTTLGGSVDGVLREYVVLPYQSVVKLPNTDHSWEQWAALVGAGGTAWNSFYGPQQLKPGQIVLVLGKAPYGNPNL